MRTQILFAVLALVAHAAARPRREGGYKHKIVSLNSAVNKTVCPIKVHLDIEDNRIPRVIKTIKCDTGKARHCCHSHDAKSRAQCTELRDDVLVFYPDGVPGLNGEKSMKLPMSVGCVCMLQEFSEGNTTPDPDYAR